MTIYRFFLFYLFSLGSYSITAQSLTLKKPKNIIIIIADGMGFNQLKATEYYLYGDADSCVLRKNEFITLAQATHPAIVENKTDKIYSSGYNVESVTRNPKNLAAGYTDSGAAATALATGKKTYNGAIGIGVNGDTLVTLVELTKSLGKSAGLVTSVPISHATPAGFVAHNCDRSNYEEIARQIIFNSQLDVLMGCGNPDYNKNGELQKMNAKFVGGEELWEQLKSPKPQTTFNIGELKYTVRDINNDKKPDAWTLIQDSADFEQLTKCKSSKRILGIPKVFNTLQQERRLSEDHRMPFETPFIKDLPSLSLMTAGALKVLSSNKKGFLLMVEGGAVDWAAHDNQLDRMIEEMSGWLSTVEAVVNWVNKNSNWNETLLIVTADHECGFLWGEEGNDKFSPIINMGKGNIPKMKWYSTDHTNSLVPFFAKGAGSNVFNLFADEYDPNYGYFIQNAEVAQAIFLLWGKMGK